MSGASLRRSRTYQKVYMAHVGMAKPRDLAHFTRALMMMLFIAVPAFALSRLAVDGPRVEGPLTSGGNSQTVPDYVIRYGKQRPYSFTIHPKGVQAYLSRSASAQHIDLRAKQYSTACATALGRSVSSVRHRPACASNSAYAADEVYHRPARAGFG